MRANIEYLASLFKVVEGAPGSIALGKILFNVVLILVGENGTGETPMKYCPTGSR